MGTEEREFPLGGDEDELIESGGDRLGGEPVEQGASADREELLGQDAGEGEESGAETGGRDDRGDPGAVSGGPPGHRSNLPLPSAVLKLRTAADGACILRVRDEFQEFVDSIIVTITIVEVVNIVVVVILVAIRVL